MSVHLGVIRVLPHDHPMLPEMVDTTDPANRECVANLYVSDAPGVLVPVLAELWPEMPHPETVHFWCTRTGHAGESAHASHAGPAGGPPTKLVIWGGE